jgi:hypothetical protein
LLFVHPVARGGFPAVSGEMNTAEAKARIFQELYAAFHNTGK